MSKGAKLTRRYAIKRRACRNGKPLGKKPKTK